MKLKNLAYFLSALIFSSGLFMSKAQPILKDGIVTGFRTGQKEVVFTFDACESVTPAFADRELINVIIREKLPVTIFLSGKFLLRNRDEVLKLSKYPFIEFANHSFSHPEHIERLPGSQQKNQVMRTDSLIKSLGLNSLRCFRFPGGNYNSVAVDNVRKMGYKIVHWSFASGDADKKIPAKALADWIRLKTKPGTIYIFHINGRGYKTAEILPGFLQYLYKKGYKVRRLSEMLN